MATLIIWTQSDIDTLKAAIAGGILEVEYDGPPRRKMRYQDLGEMRKLLADMVHEVSGSSAPNYRLAKTRRGFRDG